MITPKSNVPSDAPTRTDVRTSARAERREDFHEVLSRDRARAAERSLEHARTRDEARHASQDRDDDRVRARREKVDGHAERTAHEDRSDVDRADPQSHTSATEETGADEGRDTAPADAEAGKTVNDDQSDAPTPGKAKTSREPALVSGPGNVNHQSELPLEQLLVKTPGEVATDAELPTDPSGGDLGAGADGDGSPTLYAPALARTSVAPVSDTVAPAAIPSAQTSTDAQAVELPRATHTATNADTRAGQQFVVANAVTPGADAVVKPNEVPPQRLTPAELPQFLQSLAVHVDAPAGSATVELEPLELGRLTVELTLQPEGGLRAEVRAERPDGYAAIEARLPELRASLIERGFANADIQLSLGLAQRESRRDAPSSGPRRGRSDTNRPLETERVRALVPNGVGSVDLWA